MANVTPSILISGYIRRIERLYESIVIPIDIYRLIYLYQHVNDKWSTKYLIDEVAIDETGTYLRKSTKQLATSFGSHVVSYGIFKWELTLTKFMQHFRYYSMVPVVGVIEDNEHNLTLYQNSPLWDKCGYQLCGGSSLLFGMKKYGNITKNYQCKFKHWGDKLDIILNLNDLTITFVLNGRNCAKFSKFG
eukprot:UN06249